LAVSVPGSGLLMNADPLRLAQVVSNLLGNAAKYTPPHGHIWLSATLEAGDVVIRVRDDGDGIGPDLLPHVFDLFVQGAQTVARSGGGLGLGLALVKSFVTAHGGTVRAASAGAGLGSEFIVRVPAISEADARAAAPPVELPRAAHGKRILIVDDNDDARETLAEILRELGHSVEVAPDGPAALRQLLAFPAEVAILDIGLPVMDGFELAQRVSAQQTSARPRLIALSGYGQERDIAQGRAAGFDAHLVKPVDLSALLSAIDS
ncbi:MAG: histidine kinase, partial [Myxococcales bacterium]|nr:histidine kinase [Myxococcales bacterium]